MRQYIDVKRASAVAALLLGAIAGPGANPAAASPPRLATFDELEKQLGSPGLRLLDARPKTDYDAGHLPGAVWVDLKQAAEIVAAPDGFSDRDAWEAWLAPLGIGPDVDVLVYDANRQLDAARTWWLLSYLGVERVGLIDGGFDLWKQQGRPVTTEPPQVEPRPFPVSFRKDRHATREDVLAALGAKSAVVLDARTDDEFTGAKRLSKRGGRIPAACHLEWTNMVDTDGRFLDEPALRAKVAAAGVTGDAPVISHCQGGGRASVNAFVLERLGFTARNYYLGWSDWGNADDVPIEAETTSSPEPKP